MPDKEFEPDDPFQPVAVQVATPGYDGMEAMARCFVEEYAMLGWPPEKIFRLFTIEEFAGSHSVLLQRGPAYVRTLIESVFGTPLKPTAEPEAVWLMRAGGAAASEGESDAPGL